MDPFHVMVMRGARRRLAGQSAQSGLTGPADIPEPEPPSGPKNLRDRLRSLRESTKGMLVGLPRVFRLVWETNPWLTGGLALATILAGFVPAATAVTAKWLINSVLYGIQVHMGVKPDSTSLPPINLPFIALHLPKTTAIGVIVELAILQFLIYAFSSVLSTLRNITQQLLQEGVSLKIQMLIMDHAVKLDLPFYEDSASYDLMRQAQQEAAVRPVTMISAAFGLVQTGITFASMVALLLGLNPLLALVALVSPVPQFISDTRYGWRGFNLARWASPIRRRMQYLLSLVTTDTYAKETKLFGLGPYFIQRFKLLAGTYYDRQRRLVTARYLIGYLWGILTTVAGSLTYLYVAIQAVAGKLTLGDLTLYTQAASSVQNSIQGLLSGFSSMYENNLYLNNLYWFLATEPTIPRAAKPSALPQPLRGDVQFEHVSFSYPGSGAEAVRDVSFTIAPGETVAIVGRNGAGKSTLIKLLCRLYDPTAGRILIDGIDIRDLDPEQLRERIGGMFQDFVTYQATASENIGLGDLPKIEDRPAIEQAARKGGADGVINELPEGYDTPLGKWFDDGANLSGGEWQKVALGRAFMRDVPVLVLDEPTSALDAQAEYELFARLRALSYGRTAVFISHRFSTVRQADRILFLEHGRLVEEGTHEELMALGGRYALLFNMQASAYTGEMLDIEEVLPEGSSGDGVRDGGRREDLHPPDRTLLRRRS